MDRKFVDSAGGVTRRCADDRRDRGPVTFTLKVTDHSNFKNHGDHVSQAGDKADVPRSPVPR